MGFLFAIARKKDRSPQFCVDYKKLNKRMKADKYLIPNIEDVFDEMAGLAAFSKLDMFEGY